MVPQYCEAYFSYPFSYCLPPLSVCVVDNNHWFRRVLSVLSVTAMLFIVQTPCNINMVCYRILKPFFQIIFSGLKAFEHFEWDFCCLCFEFSQKTTNPRRFKQSHTQRGKKDCAEGETSSCKNVTVSRCPYTGLLDFWKDLTEMQHTSKPEKNDTC